LTANVIFLTRKITRRFEVCHLSRSPAQEGLPMFTAEQYRAKASEYAKLARMANGSNEALEFQRLERNFTELADNAQWVTDNHGKIVHATEHATAPFTPNPSPQSISPQ
jgi:hypothetical protein